MNNFFKKTKNRFIIAIIISVILHIPIALSETFSTLFAIAEMNIIIGDTEIEDLIKQREERLRKERENRKLGVYGKGIHYIGHFKEFYSKRKKELAKKFVLLENNQLNSMLNKQEKEIEKLKKKLIAKKKAIEKKKREERERKRKELERKKREEERKKKEERTKDHKIARDNKTEDKDDTKKENIIKVPKDDKKDGKNGENDKKIAKTDGDKKPKRKGVYFNIYRYKTLILEMYKYYEIGELAKYNDELEIEVKANIKKDGSFRNTELAIASKSDILDKLVLEIMKNLSIEMKENFEVEPRLRFMSAIAMKIKTNREKLNVNFEVKFNTGMTARVIALAVEQAINAGKKISKHKIDTMLILNNMKIDRKGSNVVIKVEMPTEEALKHMARHWVKAYPNKPIPKRHN